jgi:tRNA(Arg) A34 adenosine deaminase TadA
MDHESETTDQHADCFVEIVHHAQQLDTSPAAPQFIEALAVAVDPRACSALVKILSTELPLKGVADEGLDLSHLKRVRRTENRNDSRYLDDRSNDETLPQPENAANGESSSQLGPPEKKQKVTADEPVILEVLLGATSVLDARFGRLPSDETRIDLSTLAAHFPIHNVRTVRVSSRLAESEEEWKKFNAIWPMVYLPNKTKEFLEAERKLGDDEIAMMKRGIEAAIDDANRASGGGGGGSNGVVVMCPQSGRIVATAEGERQRQAPLLIGTIPIPPNPLTTSYILAIQAVSRIERHVIATGHGGRANTSFQNGQYLCTGYDVYATMEPTIYEAMALVHARIRRLVFGCARRDSGVRRANGGIVDAHVHALPGTNHHYRAFACRKASPLWQQCTSPTSGIGCHSEEQLEPA